MNIAHYLTCLRIFTGPIFLICYTNYETLGINIGFLPWILLILLIVSEMSDAFDGFLARKYNQVTDLGKILDPMADSIYRTSIFLTFTQPPVSIPLWVALIFFYRDSVIATLRTICALKGFALAARISGKVKAIIQAFSAFCIIILMVSENFGILSLEYLTTVSTLLALTAAVYTLYSGFDYLFANRSYVTKVLVV